MLRRSAKEPEWSHAQDTSAPKSSIVSAPRKAIEHQDDQAAHPWTNGQARSDDRTKQRGDRQGLSLSEPKSLKGPSSPSGRRHFAKNLKALRWNTPFEPSAVAWTKGPHPSSSTASLIPGHTGVAGQI